MKVVAYSIKPYEKEFLVRANQKKHDITLISNSLNIATAGYAEGKDGVIVFANDDVSEKVISKLAGYGVKYITTRSSGTDHIDKKAAERKGIKIASVPGYSPHAIAEHAVALVMALNRRLIQANEQVNHFDFRPENLVGFNLQGKTAGIIGLGGTGLAVAAIFNGFGCRVLGYDITITDNQGYIEPRELETLFRESDIISLHVPLTEQTRHLISKKTISSMKEGVMLINTSRGGLLKSADVLEAVETGKIGYLGLDVYEFEKGLFFEDHENDEKKDTLLKRLLEHPNVLITPHQAFLTSEALQQIAVQTIKNLDTWQQEKNAADTNLNNNNPVAAGSPTP